MKDVAAVFAPMIADWQEMAARYSDDELRLIVDFYGADGGGVPRAPRSGCAALPERPSRGHRPVPPRRPVPNQPGGAGPYRADAATPAADAQVGERRPGGAVAAHAVHAAARRGGRRAQVDAGQRGAVRVPPRRGPEERLPQRARPAVDVAADVVGVVPLHVGGGLDRPGQDQVAEARARTARSAPRSGRTCPRSSRAARGSTPTACAARPGPGSGRPRPAGRPGRTGAPGAGPRPRPPRCAPPRRACRPGAPCPPPGRRRPARAPARSAPSRPCRRRARTGSAASARRAAGPGAGRRRGRRAGAGVTSSSTARAGGRSSRELTQRPVSTRPPSDVSSATSASISRALPPSTKRPAHRVRDHQEQQPEGAGQRRGRAEASCARPRRRAAPRASSVRNRRASRLAGSRPSRPNRAMASGCRGTERSSGASSVGQRSAAASRTSGPSSRR